MKTKILIDMDDVLVDWTGEAFKTFGLNKNSVKLVQLLEEQWGMDHVLDEAKMWERLDELGADWWANLPPLPWATELYEACKELGEVCILTSPSDHPSSSAGKVEWLKKHLKTRDFLIGKPKHFCANRSAVLIDDRPSNCEKFLENGGHPFLWPSPYRMGRFDPTGTSSIAKVRDHINAVQFHLDRGSRFSFYCRPDESTADVKGNGNVDLSLHGNNDFVGAVGETA